MPESTAAPQIWLSFDCLIKLAFVPRFLLKELRAYVSVLLSCLDKKHSLILQAEGDVHKFAKARLDAAIQRRRQAFEDDQEAAREAAGERACP